MPTVDFATFCCTKDGHRLHAPGQLNKQVFSNGYNFNRVFVIHQLCDPYEFSNPFFEDCPSLPIEIYTIKNIDSVLTGAGIDIEKPQYTSTVDKAHTWKNHVANHLEAVRHSDANYIVFADNDCWMIRQPPSDSWVKRGIDILSSNHDVFIVSPNDGEPERMTQVISQQMFMVKVDDFVHADFNQPGWDGNPHVPGGPLPEYWAMLEGRMALYCKYTNRYRYVLSSEYRYWHFNKTNPQTDLFETDLSKW